MLGVEALSSLPHDHTMVAIFLAKVRRAISGLMPLVSKAV